MRSKSRFGKIFASLLLALVAIPGFEPGAEVAVAVPPPAPTLVGPANGASVTIPLTISWSQVPDAGGYNWEISLTSGFASVLERNLALLSGATTITDTISGLPPGTYFWRVQAVSRDLEAGPWSSPRSFTITGAGPGVPGTAVLNPPHNATQFHSWENITFSWTPVPGAVNYILQESIDPTFPVGTRIRQVNIPGPTERISFNPSNQGTFKARVIAVNASGLMGQPSNTVEFSVLDSNPFPAPPTLVAPANGTSSQLPLTLSWTHVPNHDELGYTLQISRNSTFTQIESSFGVTENSKIVTSLTTGTKFWRVRSQHGYIGSNRGLHRLVGDRDVHGPRHSAADGCGHVPVAQVQRGRGSGFGGDHRGRAGGGATVTLTTSHPSLLPELPSSTFITAGDSSANVLVAPDRIPQLAQGHARRLRHDANDGDGDGDVQRDVGVHDDHHRAAEAERHPVPAVPGQGDRRRPHGRDRGPGDRLLRRLLRRAGSTGRVPGQPVELVAGRDRAGVDDHSRGSRW